MWRKKQKTIQLTQYFKNTIKEQFIHQWYHDVNFPSGIRWESCSGNITIVVTATSSGVLGNLKALLDYLVEGGSLQTRYNTALNL